jgi:hypothetical protein
LGFSIGVALDEGVIGERRGTLFHPGDAPTGGFLAMVPASMIVLREKSSRHPRFYFHNL